MAFTTKTTEQKILISVEADSKDAREDLKKLEREAEKSMFGIRKHISEAFASLGDLNGTVEKAKRAIGDISGAFGAFGGALRGYAESEKLYANTASFNIDRISKALKGLKTDHQIMIEVSQLSRGEQALSQQQMETLATAIAGFERKGLDAGKAMDIVRQAVVQLSTDGLKEMGIHVDKTGLSMDVQADRGELLRRVLDSLTLSSREFASAQLTAGEQAAKTAVKLENVLDKLKRTGEQAAAFAASQVDAGAQAFMQQMMGKIDSPYGVRTPSVAEMWGDYAQRMAAYQRHIAAGTGREYAINMGMVTPDISFGAASVTPAANGNAPKIGGRSVAAARTVSQALAALSREISADVGQLSSSIGATSLGSAAGYADPLGADMTAALDGAKNNALTGDWNARMASFDAQKKQQQELVQAIVGTTDATQMAAQAFGTFSSAAGDAWMNALSGAENFGTGMRKAFGQSIGGVSKNLFATGIQESVLSLASLALGPIGGVSAAMHGKAAAAAFAGAAITGGLAASLGAGGAASGARPGGGGGAGAAAPVGRFANGPSNGGGREIVYVVGDPFDTETNPRRRQQNAKRLLKQAGYSPNGSGDF